MQWPSQIFFKKKILFYIWVLILEILFYKITLLPLKNIIDSFNIIIIDTNVYIISLQIVKVTNSYWFEFGPITYIISNLLSLVNQFYLKQTI